MFVFTLFHQLRLASSCIQIDYQDTWVTTLFGGWLPFPGVGYQQKFSVVGAVAFTGAYLLLTGQILRSMTYLGTPAGYPLIDAHLGAFDKALGFDGLAHVAWVNATPWAIIILNEVYMSILSDMMIVRALLVVMCRFERIRQLLLINGSLGPLSIVFCTSLPEIGAYTMHR